MTAQPKRRDLRFALSRKLFKESSFCVKHF